MYQYIEISHEHMHVHEIQLQIKLGTTLSKNRQLCDMTLLFRIN